MKNLLVAVFSLIVFAFTAPLEAKTYEKYKIMEIHEDDRRVLLDWNDDLPTETVKVVTAKAEDVVLGKHFHKKKTERFLLVQGEAKVLLADSNGEQYFDMQLYRPITIHPGIKHTFTLKKESILLCLSDKLYDSKDDFYQLE